jgi:hypothetical protein
LWFRNADLGMEGANEPAGRGTRTPWSAGSVQPLIARECDLVGIAGKRSRAEIAGALIKTANSA